MAHTTQPIFTLDIQSSIRTISGVHMMLDRDLARLFEVPTKRLNEQVKRNPERFPKNFAFKLTRKEKNEVVANCDHLRSLKFSPHLPIAFTEQGVAMLSSVLKSKVAIKISIRIIESFIQMRSFLTTNASIFQRLNTVEQKQLLFQHKTEDHFKKIFQALENKTLTPKQGIFFDGQIFDAYVFTNKLIKSAKKSLILIDKF